MRKLFTLFSIMSALNFLTNCGESHDEDSRVISRESIQGRWLLISEHFHTKYSHGEESDTTIFFRDYELRINSTDTCEIFSGGGTCRFEMSYVVPDTLTFSSCPIGLYCDPIIYLIAYKIIDFDRNEKMVLQYIEDIYDYTSESNTIIRTDTRTRYYIRD